MARRSSPYLGVALAVGVALGGGALLLASRGDRQLALLVFLPGIAVAEYFFGLFGGLPAVGLSVLASAWYRIHIVPLGPERHLPERFAWENEVILLIAGLLIVTFIELLRRSRSRELGGAMELRQLLANMADAAFVFNTELRLVDANAAAFRMAGRPPRELMGYAWSRLRELLSPEPSPAPPPGALRRALAGESFSGIRATLRDARDGRLIHVLASLAPLRGSGGAVTGVLLVMTDLTEIVALQRRISDVERHEAMRRMAEGIIHDFNNILEVVRKAAAMLDLIETQPAEERRRYRAMIHTATRRGAETVARLREHLTDTPEAVGPMDLNQAAREAIELTAPLWRSRPKLRLETDLRPLPPVRGSATDLRRAITNLVINAVDAVGDEPGQITVHSEATGNHVVLWIQDTGPGVPRSRQREIFLPYHTTKPKGTGLGLFSAQRVVVAQGGQLTLEPHAGRGARFQIELPAAPAGQKAS